MAILLAMLLQDADTFVVHFHGSTKLVEEQMKKAKVKGKAIHLGSGSKVYSDAMKDPAAFQKIFEEAGKPKKLYLSSFSAGYGAIREILKHGKWEIAGVLLADSLHAGYVNKKPDPDQMKPFVDFAKSGKLLYLTHSEIVPGTYASTTETADAILEAIGAKREKASGKNALGMTLLTKAEKDRVHVRGYAGTTGDDHMKHLQNLSELFEQIP